MGLITLAAVLEPALTQVAPHVGRFGPLAGAPGGILGGPDSGGLLAPGLALAGLTVWTGVALPRPRGACVRAISSDTKQPGN